jgi:flagellar biosynthesis/type III secretory pathway M-ring protein FliF/YscJ
VQPQIGRPTGSAAVHHSLAVVTEVELVLIGGVVLAVAAVLLMRRVRRRQEARRRHGDELRARLLMAELCPNGWQAQLMIHGTPPTDAPRADRALVSVDWCELPAEGEEPPPVRRVWAASIAEALAAMVEDRRADEVLERIERMASADDDPWDAL